MRQQDQKTARIDIADDLPRFPAIVDIPKGRAPFLMARLWRERDGFAGRRLHDDANTDECVTAPSGSHDLLLPRPATS
jgi:hypothetical protein